MKALCIIGSPKIDGTTACVVETVTKGMELNNINVKKIILGEMQINYCKGCKACSKTQKCVQRDDMDIIINHLLEADIVLIASPSYWGDITGQLKVFLDRSTPLSDTSGESIVPKGKIGISVAIRTGNRVDENMHIIHTIEHYFGHLGIRPVKRFTIESAPSKERFKSNQEKVEEAYLLGANILNCIF